MKAIVTVGIEVPADELTSEELIQIRERVKTAIEQGVYVRRTQKPFVYNLKAVVAHVEITQEEQS